VVSTFDHSRCERTHGAVVRRERLVELGHDSADGRALFNQVYLESSIGKIQGRLHSAYTGTDDQHGAGLVIGCVQRLSPSDQDRARTETGLEKYTNYYTPEVHAWHEKYQYPFAPFHIYRNNPYFLVGFDIFEFTTARKFCLLVRMPPVTMAAGRGGIPEKTVQGGRKPQGETEWPLKRSR
jgi:hypothetical protein